MKKHKATTMSYIVDFGETTFIINDSLASGEEFRIQHVLSMVHCLQNPHWTFVLGSGYPMMGVAPPQHPRTPKVQRNRFE